MKNQKLKIKCKNCGKVFKSKKDLIGKYYCGFQPCENAEPDVYICPVCNKIIIG